MSFEVSGRKHTLVAGAGSFAAVPAGLYRGLTPPDP
jgi:hypothetical protein